MKSFLVFFLLAVFSLGSFTSCSSTQKQKWEQKRRAKKFEKEKQKRFEEDAEAYRQARKRHLDIQSRKTIKEMKKNQRLSQRQNAGKKEFFLVRWFKKKNYKTRRQGGRRQ